MGATSPNTIWTPDFFWEAPADTREHIDHYNDLSVDERLKAEYLYGPYFQEVSQTAKDQPPELIKEFAEFVMHAVAADGMLRVPPNPVTYATIQRASYCGQAENGQNLTTRSEQWLRTLVGEDFKGQQKLLTFEEQQARDQAEAERIGCKPDDLIPVDFVKVSVRTDSTEIYEWPKIPDLIKDWPLVDVRVRTNGILLGVTYPDYQRGHPVSLPPTPARIEQLRTYLEQFPLPAEAPEGDDLPKQS